MNLTINSILELIEKDTAKFTQEKWYKNIKIFKWYKNIKIFYNENDIFFF